MIGDDAARAEWIERDGLGGYARATVGGWRTRRDQGLLVTATSSGPPFVTVAGFDAWVDTPGGKFALTTQRYAPGVSHPDGRQRIAEFAASPWPRWRFALEDGSAVEQEILMPHGAALTAVAWRMRGPRVGASLSIRPFVAARRVDTLHAENGSFRFDPDIVDGRLVWRPYPGVPGIVVTMNGDYSHHPLWYRSFVLDDDLEDDVAAEEDLASPGVFRWDFMRGEAVWIVGDETALAGGAFGAESAETTLAALRDAERSRRALLGPSA